MIKKLIVILISGCILSCSSPKKEKETSSTNEIKKSPDQYIPPGFHTVVTSGGGNQPVSLLFKDSLYHLYYTTKADEIGHLQSKDLLDWGYADPVSINSSYGKVEYDQFNTSRLAEPWVKYWVDDSQLIISTSANGVSNWKDRTVLQTNSINPVITWDDDLRQWILVLINENKLEFYTSQNLLTWKESSVISYEDAINSISLSQMDNSWLLILNGEDIKYQLGTFDGILFTPSNTPQSFLKGSNFLSANVFSVSDKTLLFTQNEATFDTSSTTFSIPLEVTIRNQNILLSPSSEFKSKFIGKKRGKISYLIAKGPSWYSFTIDDKILSNLRMKIFDSSSALEIKWDVNKQTIEFDRSNASIGNTNIISSHLSLNPNNLKIDILVDHNVVDIFFNDGEAYFSIQVNPSLFFSNVNLWMDGEQYNAKGILFHIRV